MLLVEGKFRVREETVRLGGKPVFVSKGGTGTLVEGKVVLCPGF